MALQALAKRRRLAQTSRFGPVPPDDMALVRAFLKDDAFMITGPLQWNALGLGSTALFSATLVYNSKRSGEFRLAGRRFLFRRVRFPKKPPAEWFVIDLLENHEMAGVAISALEEPLRRAVRAGRFDRGRLREMAATYGSQPTQAFVARCPP